MKCKFFMASIAVLSVVACASHPLDEAAAETPVLESVEQRLSYTVGGKIAEQFEHDGIEVDFAALNLGVSDTMADKPSRLSDSQIQDAISALQALKDKRQSAAIQENKIESDAYLAMNAAKEGVVTTSTGLQYKEVKSGDGEKPELGDNVVVHYKGMLTDGTVFDSSYARNEPAKFPVAKVIPGWVEALQLMNVGDQWQVTIPSELAYGERGAGQHIGPNATLVFEIELLEVNKP